LSTRDGTPIPGIGFEARTESGAYHAETNVRGIANVLIADSESDDTAFVLLDSDSAVTQQRTRAMLRTYP